MKEDRLISHKFKRYFNSNQEDLKKTTTFSSVIFLNHVLSQEEENKWKWFFSTLGIIFQFFCVNVRKRSIQYYISTFLSSIERKKVMKPNQTSSRKTSCSENSSSPHWRTNMELLIQKQGKHIPQEHIPELPEADKEKQNLCRELHEKLGAISPFILSSTFYTDQTSVSLQDYTHCSVIEYQDAPYHMGKCHLQIPHKMHPTILHLMVVNMQKLYKFSNNKDSHIVVKHTGAYVKTSSHTLPASHNKWYVFLMLFTK